MELGVAVWLREETPSACRLVGPSERVICRLTKATICSLGNYFPYSPDTTSVQTVARLITAD